MLVLVFMGEPVIPVMMHLLLSPQRSRYWLSLMNPISVSMKFRERGGPDFVPRTFLARWLDLSL